MVFRAYLYIIILLLGMVMFVACEQLGFTKKEVSEKSSKAQKTEKKLCYPTKLVINSDILRTIVITYQNGKAIKAETTIKNTGNKIDVTFEYDTTGRVSKLITHPENTETNYLYDNKGFLKEIKSGTIVQKFEYNEKNLIIKQITYVNEKIYMYNEYKYNDKKQPVSLNRYESDGKISSTVEIEYDKKINPFINLSAKINTAEMMYGYPVGNSPNNPVKFTTVYHEQSKWKIHGEFKEPGDKDVVTAKLKYNKSGYPEQYIALTDTISFEYNCR